MNQKTRINFFKLILALSILVTCVRADSNYQAAFNNDAHWPTFVTPLKDISIQNNNDVLQSGMRVVLVRAYKDGKLGIVDRAGTFLIEHSDTDFVLQVNQSLTNNSTPPYGSFLHQIGRRLYSPSYHESRAVPEKVLNAYKYFFICRIDPTKDCLENFLNKLEPYRNKLKHNKCGVIVVFKRVIPNKEFYDLLNKFEFPYYAVAPVFTKGFIDAEFTEIESNSNYLFLAKSGKAIRSDKSISETLAILEDLTL